MESMLYLCPDCGHMVSVRAAACPSCGCGLAPPQRSEGLFLQTLNAGCFVVLLGAGAVVCLILGVFAWNAFLSLTR